MWLIYSKNRTLCTVVRLVGYMGHNLKFKMCTSLLASTATRSLQLLYRKQQCKWRKLTVCCCFTKTNQWWQHRESGLNPPTRSSIHAWYKQFTQHGCLWKDNSSGHPPISKVTVDSATDVHVHPMKDNKMCQQGTRHPYADFLIVHFTKFFLSNQTI
jgi:hypothetical protein